MFPAFARVTGDPTAWDVTELLLPAGNGRGAPLDHRRRSDGIRRETPSSGSSRGNRLATVRSQRAALPDLPRVSVDFTAGRADHCPSQGVTVPFPGDRGVRSVVAVRPRSARHGFSPGPPPAFVSVREGHPPPNRRGSGARSEEEDPTTVRFPERNLPVARPYPLAGCRGLRPTGAGLPRPRVHTGERGVE